MELEFTLEKADLLAYAAYAKKAMSLIIRPRLVNLSIMWAVACMVIILSGFFIDRHHMLLTLVILLGIVCALLAYSKLYLKRYFENYYTPEFFPDSFVSQKILLDPKMLVNVRQNSRAEFLWSAINEVVHTQAHTFILLPNKTGFIVPHRIFRNSTEIQGFKDQLGAMWNSGKTNKATQLNASAK